MTKRKIFAAVYALSFLIASVCFVFVPRAKADSEAGSEAGSESGALGARRARRYYRRQKQAERKREQQVNMREARDDTRRSKLTGRQTVQNYGNGGGHHRHQTQSQQQP